MPKINFGEPLYDLDGKQVIDPANRKSVTLGSTCLNALTLSYNDETPTGEEKTKRFDLALKIMHATATDRVDALGIADLVVEDVVLLKQLVGKAYGPMIVGPAFALLEGKPNPLKKMTPPPAANADGQSAALN